MMSNGWYAPVASAGSSDTAGAMRELMDDPARRDRLGAGAAERARSELSWERHLGDLEDAYAAARRQASS